MNNISQLLLDAAELLSEGAVKTSKKHKLDNYLKQYGYNKTDKTITVDGKTVDVKERSKKEDGGYGTNLNTNFKTGKQTLNIGKEFTKLKNNKRRDALLNHEIGHAKLHNLVDANATLNVKEQVIKDTIDSKNYGKAANYAFESGYKNAKDFTDKDKARLQNIKYFNENNKGEHSTPTEYEADTYARGKKNGDQLNRAIREGYKHIRKYDTDSIDKRAREDEKDLKDNGKDVPKYSKLRDKVKSENAKYSKAYDEDYKDRKKALADKRIDRSVYNETISELLTEAINLLEME